MNRKECVAYCLQNTSLIPNKPTATAEAPVNIALVKYWGKRNEELHLPITDSLSVSLSLKTKTTVQLCEGRDSFELNGQKVEETCAFYKRLSSFLDLFRPSATATFHVHTINEGPTAAGLASSASGFAALVLALNDLFAWNLPPHLLSILARLGSGSACRSIHTGFVLWKKGEREDGLDSYATPLKESWPGLQMAYIPIDLGEKSVSSREGMKRTVETSPLYRVWPELVKNHTTEAMRAIQTKDFTLLGELSEQSALAMHATMMAARPPVLLWQPETVKILHNIWQVRKEGLPVYATLDAGPNVKILFLEDEAKEIARAFPQMIPLGLMNS